MWIHGKRTAFHTLSALATDSLWFISGIGEECSLVCHFSAKVGMTYIGYQFLNHKRH